MTCKNTQKTAFTRVSPWLLLSILLAITGCKGGSGQSTTASANAADASDNRLDGAASSPQNSPGQKPAPDTLDRPTLKWAAPAFREDGSQLLVSDISEYRIYYRLRHNDSYKAISHPVEEGTAFGLRQFKPGAYEFSVTAVDTEGRESRRSDGVEVDLI